MAYKRKSFALPLIKGTSSSDYSLIVWYTYKRQGKLFREACNPVCEEYDGYSIFRMPTVSEITSDWLGENIKLGFEGITNIERNPNLPYRMSY